MYRIFNVDNLFWNIATLKLVSNVFESQKLVSDQHAKK